MTQDSQCKDGSAGSFGGTESLAPLNFNTSSYVENLKNETSGQDGGIGKHGFPPCITTAKITTKVQNNCHSEPSENQAV